MPRILALAAVRGDEGPIAADLAGEWAATNPERLARAAGDAAKADAVRDLLISKSGPGHVDEPTSADATLARGFVEALLWELDAPTRRVGDLRLQRWIRLGGVVIVLAALAFGIHRLSLGPNLAAGKPFHLSSNWPPCDAPMKCAQLLFHTEQQDNPWFEYDLGEPTKVHRVEVTNRSDCCSERVVPLVVELSTDHQKWKEVARQTKDFTTWTAKFPAQKTRYVRLRVPRTTVFHLEEVIVR